MSKCAEDTKFSLSESKALLISTPTAFLVDSLLSNNTSMMNDARRIKQMQQHFLHIRSTLARFLRLRQSWTLTTAVIMPLFLCHNLYSLLVITIFSKSKSLLAQLISFWDTSNLLFLLVGNKFEIDFVDS